MIETWDKDDAGVEVEKAGKSTRSSVVDAALNKLLKTLDEVEKFYDCIGGIIGYQLVVLELLLSQTAKVRSTLSSHTSESFKNMLQKFHVPFGTNLLKDIEYASQAALWGLEVTSSPSRYLPPLLLKQKKPKNSQMIILCRKFLVSSLEDRTENMGKMSEDKGKQRREQFR
ncbi:hypothetical protein HPP92_007388 [Vanilla planifolia]|uniref:Uncharacterized protein n=1 Tax=Vanilla planifolia TaxID=51239 RepID=A0A835VB75_VANPL|nr:hypothetical protein HPP92_007388 [Vanilla planifolia]